MTLPLIYAFEGTTTHNQEVIRKAIEDQSADIELIIQIIHSTDALQRCQQNITHHIQAAQSSLAQLDASPFNHNITKILQFIKERTLKSSQA